MMSKLFHLFQEMARVQKFLHKPTVNEKWTEFIKTLTI